MIQMLSPFSSSRVHHEYWKLCVTRTGLSLLLQPYIGRFPLIPSLFPLQFFLKFVSLRRALHNSSSPLRKCCMFFFFWLFLFPAKYFWNRTDARGENQKQRNFVRQVEWQCWLFSGLVPLVVDGCSVLLVHITGLSSIQQPPVQWVPGLSRG